jgi:hypothetical protein
VAQLEQQQAPASWEGGEQRCFQDVFFCGQKIELARGAPREHEAAWSEAERTTALAKAVPIEPFSYGQAVVHYEMQQPREGQAAEDGISLQVAAAAAAPKPEQEERSKSSGRLKVLLMKRGGEGRQILNADELLEQCNAWQYRAPNGTAIATADCREVRLRWVPVCGAARLVAEIFGSLHCSMQQQDGWAPLITASTCPLQVSMPDLAAGVAAARKADVFIGMHGECRMQGGTTRGCVPRNPGSACCTGAPVLQRGRHQTYRLPSSRLPARSVSACLQAPTWATAG